MAYLHLKISRLNQNCSTTTTFQHLIIRLRASRCVIVEVSNAEEPSEERFLAHANREAKLILFIITLTTSIITLPNYNIYPLQRNLITCSVESNKPNQLSNISLHISVDVIVFDQFPMSFDSTQHIMYRYKLLGVPSKEWCLFRFLIWIVTWLVR